MKEISFTTTQPPDMDRINRSAFKTIVVIGTTIFLGEVLTMAFIYILPIPSPLMASLLDGALLLILLSPVVYFYIYNPLHHALQEKIEYQQALEENQKHLKTVFQTCPDGIAISRLEDGLITEINEGFTKLTGYSNAEAIGKTTLQLNLWKAPQDRKKMTTILSKEGQLINFETKLCHKESDVFHGLLSAKIIKIRNEQHILSVTRNIDALKHAEQKILASNRFLHIANRTSAIGELLELFSKEIEQLTEYSSVGIVVMDNEETFSFKYPDECKNKKIDALKRIWIEKALMVIYNNQKDRFNQSGLRDWRPMYDNRVSQVNIEDRPNSQKDFYKACQLAGFESVALIPIYGENRLIGIIYLGHGCNNFFEVEVIKIIESAALQLGLAIERAYIQENLRKYSQNLESMVAERTAQLNEANILLKDEIAKKNESEEKLLFHQNRLRELTTDLLNAQERERKKIAAELHDSVGHNLTIVKIGLKDLITNYTAEKTRQTIDDILQRIDQMLQETRSMSFTLSPPSLYSVGIGAALEELCEITIEQHDLQVLFRQDHKSLMLDEDFRFFVYSMARELLFNVVKHACAKKAVMEINNSGGKLMLTVKDNGGGFDPAQIDQRTGKDSGFGLFSIRERLVSLGGRMAVLSERGCGTTVTVEIPIKDHLLLGSLIS